jgi:hypothetical protein
MPPVPPSLRSLALADVTPADVKWMIGEGETLVELKEQIPSDGIGPTIASFANTLGGWVILGVSDETREVVGWKPPGRADDLDYLREQLRREVDPMPPFAARRMIVNRRRVSVVRVYESTDTPHVVRGTGSVFIRDPGAKRAIQSHDQLIALARRGEEAADRARTRLQETPAVGYVLRTPDAGYSPDDAPRAVRFVARAAPLTVTPTTRDWPLGRSAAEWCVGRVDRLVPLFSIQGLNFEREGPRLEPFGRAVAASVVQAQAAQAEDAGKVVVDSAGVFGAEIRRGPAEGDRPSFLIQSILEEELRPLARFLADALAEAEAFGRAVVEVFIVFPPNTRYTEPSAPSPRARSTPRGRSRCRPMTRRSTSSRRPGTVSSSGPSGSSNSRESRRPSGDSPMTVGPRFRRPQAF